jgi:hypothetical protein
MHRRAPLAPGTAAGRELSAEAATGRQLSRGDSEHPRLKTRTPDRLPVWRARGALAATSLLLVLELDGIDDLQGDVPECPADVAFGDPLGVFGALGVEDFHLQQEAD